MALSQKMPMELEILQFVFLIHPTVQYEGERIERRTDISIGLESNYFESYLFSCNWTKNF